MTDKTSFERKIQEIKDACAEGEYVFRGENRHYGEISSKLYRQCRKWEESDGRDPLAVLRMIPEYQVPGEEQEHSRDEFFPLVSLEKATVDSARTHIRPDASDIEVLTELQHYGGNTALIDFTRNMLIALFFACTGDFDEDGRVILFDKSGVPERTKVDYGNREDYRVFIPAGKDPRVIFQGSVFVCARRGYLDLKWDKDRCASVTIEKGLKKEFLYCLHEYHGIEARTVYNDMHGFIQSQEEYMRATGRFYFGLKRQEKERHEKAVEYYDQAIELNPRFTSAYNNRGISKIKLNRLQGAIADFDQSMKLNSTLAEPHLNRGIAKLKLDDPEGAMEDYERAMEINPRYAGPYLYRGFIKCKSQEWYEAIKDFDRAVELKPDFAEAYNYRGGAKEKLGDVGGAIRDFDKVIELRPESVKQLVEAYNARGTLKMEKLNNLEEALQDFSSAIELDSQCAKAYSNRAVAKDNMGRHEEAVEDYDHIIEEIDSEYAAAYLNRGIAKVVRLGQLQEGIEDYDTAIRLDPSFAKAYYNRGIARSKLNQPKEAVADFDKAIALNSQFAEAHFSRGISRSRLDRRDEAIEDFDRTVELKPDFAEAYFYRGSVKCELERWEEAIRDFDKAIESNPAYTEAYFRRSIANAKLGKLEEATRDYNRARELMGTSN